MWGDAHRLSERAFKMPCAYTGQASEMMQRDRLLQVRLDVIEDTVEPMRRQTARRPRRRYRQRRIGVDDVARQEFGRAFGVQLSGRRTVLGLGHHPSHHVLDHGISNEELAQRRADLAAAGSFHYAPSQTPWQEIQRAMVDQLGDGMVLKPAVKYQKVAQTYGVPRDNH